jgi:hypothetical protein
MLCHPYQYHIMRLHPPKPETTHVKKYNLKVHIRGNKNRLSTNKLNLPRDHETSLNKARRHPLFKSHLFSHNFVNVADPGCPCGCRSQTTSHILLQCPLINYICENFIHDLNEIPSFDSRMFNSARITDRCRILLHVSWAFKFHYKYHAISIVR